MSYTASDAKYLLDKAIERKIGSLPAKMNRALEILTSPEVFPALKEYIRKLEQEADDA